MPCLDFFPGPFAEWTRILFFWRKNVCNRYSIAICITITHSKWALWKWHLVDSITWNGKQAFIFQKREKNAGWINDSNLFSLVAMMWIQSVYSIIKMIVKLAPVHTLECSTDKLLRSILISSSGIISKIIVFFITFNFKYDFNNKRNLTNLVNYTQSSNLGDESAILLRTFEWLCGDHRAFFRHKYNYEY